MGLALDARAAGASSDGWVVVFVVHVRQTSRHGVIRVHGLGVHMSVGGQRILFQLCS